MAKKTIRQTGKLLETDIVGIYRKLGARKVEHDVDLAGNQIDVYVEIEAADKSLHRIAIESKDWSASVGIDVVNNFATIVDTLRRQRFIDEGIIISSKGFSRQARIAAKTHGLRLLEPDDLATLITDYHDAENGAARTIFRSITIGELRQELTIGETAAVHALADEFGCDVVTDVSIPTDNGWLNLHAAVVRGEDLVAIEIRENKGNQVPYFQIEHLIELGNTLKFPRFHKFVLYVAVVSEVDPALDEPVRERLEQIASTALCEVHIRMYRLNTLRAKYSL